MESVDALQIVYVNYRSAAYLARSLESVATHADGVPGLVITVVDNSCDVDEAAALESMLPANAELIRADHNLGFARGCNLGAAAGRAKHILFLNPDTLVLPATLPRLWQALEENEGRALIGPRHFADLGCQFAHAPFRGVRLFDTAWDQIFARGWDRRRSMRYLSQRATLHGRVGAVALRSISGGCLAVGRSTFAEIGGWNPDYWMYGEDLDLCIQARRRGVQALMLPDVPLVHFMEGSAQHLPDRVASARVEGRQRFKRERHGSVSRALDHWGTKILGRLPRLSDPWGGLSDWNGLPLEAPIGCPRWAVELARSPLFDNCLSAFPEERSIELPTDLLDTLPEDTYFLRVAGEVRPGQWRQTQIHQLTRAQVRQEAS